MVHLVDAADDLLGDGPFDPLGSFTVDALAQLKPDVRLVVHHGDPSLINAVHLLRHPLRVLSLGERVAILQSGIPPKLNELRAFLISRFL